LFVTHLAQAACPDPRIDLWVEVDYVHDGDSVRLADGRPLRLIGIDTPELARDGRPDQPLAREARDRLRDLLRANGMRLGLHFDAERVDRYGRLLAHAYLTDGRSVTATLLAEGLATQLVVPPNDAWWTCNREAEVEARTARRGLWALPGWTAREAVHLDPDSGALVLVRGRVTAVQTRRSGTRVVLEGGLVAWVPRVAVVQFDPLESLVDRRVEVRGRLRRYREEWQITVRHPFALTRVSVQTPN
jgi:endonuclease YncB( thermonuclease family)